MWMILASVFAPCFATGLLADTLPAGQIELSGDNGQFSGRITIEGLRDSEAVDGGEVPESASTLHIVADYTLDQPTFLYVDVVAEDVFGHAAGSRLAGALAELRTGQQSLVQRIWGPPDLLVPGRYRIDLQVEDGPGQSYSLQVIPVAEPAIPIDASERPAGFNIALAALGGNVRTDSQMNETDWASANLIDGFSQVLGERSLISKGWQNNPQQGLPTDIVFSFHGSLPAKISAVVINTAGIEFDQVVPGAPKHVEILVADEDIESAYRKVREARLWPVYQSQLIQFDPAPARYVKLRILSAHGQARYMAIGEVEIYESPDDLSIIADLPKNIALPALGGRIERFTSQHPQNRAWKLVDGAAGKGRSWMSADAKNGQPAELPQDLVFTFNRGLPAQIDRLEIDLDSAAQQNSEDIDNSWASEISIAARSARDAEFGEISRVALKGTAGTQTIPVNTSAQALRLRILDNHGGQNTLLGEVRVIETAQDARTSVLGQRPAETPGAELSMPTPGPDANESNDSAASSTAYAMGQLAEGTLHDVQDSDWFSMTIPGSEPEVLNVVVEGEPTLRASFALLDEQQHREHAYTPPSEAGPADEFSWLVSPGNKLLAVENLPLRVALVWDESISMKGRTEPLEKAVRRYLSGLGDEEKVQLVHFNNQVSVLLEDFTADLDVIDDALQGRFTAAGSTALGDALRRSLDLLDEVAGRRVVILFTDGQDTASAATLSDLPQRVRESGIQVYSIGLGASLENYSRRMTGSGTQFLGQIARAGGGRYYFAADENRIGPIFDEIAAQIRSVPGYSFRASTSQSIGELEVRSVGERMDSLSPPRIQLILDGSGSMRATVSDGRTRMNVAKQVIREIVEEMPAEAELALRVFGHRVAEGTPGDCEDTELLAPFAVNQAKPIQQAIDSVSGLGTTLIAHSVENAISDLNDDGGLIVVITDGEEECVPDLEAAVTALRQGNADFRLNIVGFEIDDILVQETLARVARIGGGTFVQSNDTNALKGALQAALSPRFFVEDQGGRVVADGLIDGDRITLPSGIYGLRIDSTAGLIDSRAVRIEADRTTTIALSKAGSLVAVETTTE